MSYKAGYLRSPFSDDFWLLYVLSAELDSSVVRDYYEWRTYRDARWDRLVRRWAHKHPERCQLCGEVIADQALGLTPRILFYNGEIARREYAHRECILRGIGAEP